MFTGLLRHTLTVERPTNAGDDDYGLPTRVYEPVATVRGLVQPVPGPRQYEEVREVSEAGAVVSDHVIFLPAGTDVTEADRLALADGRRYEISSVRDAGGQDHHLELWAHLLRSNAIPEGS